MKRFGLAVVISGMGIGMMGCAPGLSHRASAVPATEAAAPVEYRTAMMDETELHALIGTTTVTSGDPTPLPGSRMPISQSPSSLAASTWGASELAPSEAAEPPAHGDFDMHPYE